MDRIDARMKGEHMMGGVETGLTELDNLTGGLHNSELIILAARPSMGKTALAMNIAEHVALKLKTPCLFVSLEMSSIELADRMLCSVAEVNSSRLRNGTISKDDRKRLVETALGVAFGTDSTPDPIRVNVIERYRFTGTSPARIRYVTNTGDRHHLGDHFEPFAAAVTSLTSTDLAQALRDDGPGHVKAPPSAFRATIAEEITRLAGR